MSYRRKRASNSVMVTVRTAPSYSKPSLASTCTALHLARGNSLFADISLPCSHYVFWPLQHEGANSEKRKRVMESVFGCVTNVKWENADFDTVRWFTVLVSRGK